MRELWSLWGLMVLALVGIAGSATADESPMMDAELSTTTAAVMVSPGHIETLDANNVRRVAIQDPAIVDVTIVSPRRILVYGKQLGVTSVVLWSEKNFHGDQQAQTVRVSVVEPDHLPAPSPSIFGTSAPTVPEPEGPMPIPAAAVSDMMPEPLLHSLGADALPPSSFDEPESQEALWLSYARKVQEHLSRQIEFSDEARELRPGGKPSLRLSLLRNGTLEQAELSAVSGIEVVDAELLRAAEARSPYPAFPESLVEPSVVLEIPVVFNK